MRSFNEKVRASWVLAAAVAGVLPGRAAWAAGSAGLAQPDHVVIVIEENHDVNQIIGSPNAPYLNSLVNTGLNFTNAHGTDHDSQPNYLELFSGANPGPAGINSPLQLVYPISQNPDKDPVVADREGHSDDPITNAPFSTPNLGASLIAKGFSFAGYSESQPSVGFTGVQFPVQTRREYVQKHNAWVEWQAKKDSAIGPNQLPSTTNQPLDNLPTDFTKLPTVSFVVPNEANDFHDTVSVKGQIAVANTAVDAGGFPVNGDTTVQHGDAWLHDHIDAYRQWATTHNSLLITLFDENDFVFSRANNIPLIINGDPKLVKSGNTDQFANHFFTLRTIEDMYGLQKAGLSAQATDFAHDGTGRLVPVPAPAAAWMGLAGFAIVVAARVRYLRKGAAV